jgi:hypothetical protein
MKQKVQSTGVTGGNLEKLESHAKTKLQDSPYWPLLLEVASLCDIIAAGQNRYMTIGSTKNRSSFMLSVKGDGQDDAAWGATLEGLIEDM